MKYNTFWGYFFWILLLTSALMDFRPLAINLWDLIYNGTLRDVNIFLWLIANFFIFCLLALKVSLLYWFFPLNEHRSYDLLGTRTICDLCAGISGFYAVIMLIIVIFIGGLKVFDGIRLLQAVSIIFTPFIFIYYLNRENQR